MVKTRAYKHELENYRVSYEKAERETIEIEANKDQLLEALGLTGE